MIKFLLATYFVLFSSFAFAQTNTSSETTQRLTPQQRQAIQAITDQIVKLDEKSETAEILQAIQGINKEDIRGWAEAGTEAGKAVGNFAKEIGVLAKDFLNTFVGKATFFLVFMNYGGGKLAQFGFNVIAFVALVPLFSLFMWQTFKRFVLLLITTKEVTYNANPLLRFIGFNQKTTKTESIRHKEETYNIVMPIIAWVGIFICTLILFGIMWPNWS